MSILETLDEKTREKLKSTQLLIDASNGIGGPSVDRFFNGILKGLLNVEIINKNDLQFLNDKCGAEFVQKEVKYPLNAVDRLREYQEKKQPARCICFDGDADRIVF